MAAIATLPADAQRQLQAGTAIACVTDVVKELVENALDAGAKNIAVFVTKIHLAFKLQVLTHTHTHTPAQTPGRLGIGLHPRDG